MSESKLRLGQVKSGPKRKKTPIKNRGQIQTDFSLIDLYQAPSGANLISEFLFNSWDCLMMDSEVAFQD